MKIGIFPDNIFTFAPSYFFVSKNGGDGQEEGGGETRTVSWGC